MKTLTPVSPIASCMVELFGMMFVDIMIELLPRTKPMHVYRCTTKFSNANHIDITVHFANLAEGT